LKITVTGGSGKFGQWMVRELLAHGHEVTIFDNARAPNLGQTCSLHGDIEDLGQVVGALAGADAAIHLAAIPTHDIKTNEVTFRTNVMGTFNVLEAAWRLGIKRLVTMSSEAVLGWAPGSWEREQTPEYLPIDENHRCQPQDCYGLSKQVGEAIAQSYTAKCGMETVLIRAPWIITPDELQELARSGGRTPTTFATYHYVDVRDLAEACRLAVEHPLTGHHVLFVGSGESSVSEPLCSLLPKLMPAIGGKASLLTEARSSVSIARAKQLLGWSPRWSWRTLASQAPVTDGQA
jgi:nucleoside-diphosphate-sugar epimerase